MVGPFVKGDLAIALEAQAFTVEVGAVGEPIATSYGFQLIMVESRNEALVPPLEDVKEQVDQTLREQKYGQNLDAYLRKLWSENQVVVNPRYTTGKLADGGPYASLDQILFGEAPLGPQPDLEEATEEEAKGGDTKSSDAQDEGIQNDATQGNDAQSGDIENGATESNDAQGSDAEDDDVQNSDIQSNPAAEPTDTAPDDASPSDAEPAAEPTDITPDDATPTDTTPDDASPADATPDDTTAVPPDDPQQ